MTPTYTETLSFMRKAVKSRDTYSGLMYRHAWPTGYQELIFPSVEAAQRFADAKSARVQHPKPQA